MSWSKNLPVQPGHGVRVAHERPGGRSASRPRSMPRSSLPAVEGEEVRALPALRRRGSGCTRRSSPRRPARVARSTRRSSRGSASGSGSSTSLGRRGIALRTSTAAPAGTSPSTTRPPGRADDDDRVALRRGTPASAPGGESRRTAARTRVGGAGRARAARRGTAPPRRAQHGGGRVGGRARARPGPRALGRRARSAPRPGRRRGRSA